MQTFADLPGSRAFNGGFFSMTRMQGQTNHGGETIPHGMGITPVSALAICGHDGAGFPRISVEAMDATNITVRANHEGGSGAATQALPIWWMAFGDLGSKQLKDADQVARKFSVGHVTLGAGFGTTAVGDYAHGLGVVPQSVMIQPNATPSNTHHCYAHVYPGTGVDDTNIHWYVENHDGVAMDGTTLWIFAIT